MAKNEKEQEIEKEQELGQQETEKEQNGKKRKSKTAPLLLILLLLLLGLGGYGLGFGFGKGFGSGSSGTDSGTVKEQVSQPEEQSSVVTEEIKTVEVTVSGNKYLYQNRETSLDDLITQLKALDKDVQITVHDDNASLDAFKALTDKLTESGLSHAEK